MFLSPRVTAPFTNSINSSIYIYIYGSGRHPSLEEVLWLLPVYFLAGLPLLVHVPFTASRDIFVLYLKITHFLYEQWT